MSCFRSRSTRLGRCIAISCALLIGFNGALKHLAVAFGEESNATQSVPTIRVIRTVSVDTTSEDDLAGDQTRGESTAEIEGGRWYRVHEELVDEVIAADDLVHRVVGGDTEVLLLPTLSDPGNDDIWNVRVDIGVYGEPVLAISMTEDGSSKMRQMTQARIGRRIAIVVDDTVHAVPVLNGMLSGVALLPTQFQEERMHEIAANWPQPELSDARSGDDVGTIALRVGVCWSAVIACLMVAHFLWKWRASARDTIV